LLTGPLKRPKFVWPNPPDGLTHWVTSNYETKKMPPGIVLPVILEDLGSVPDKALDPDGRCPDGGKQFQGQRGLSLHLRSAHMELYQSRGTVEIAKTIRDQKKTRWASEETAVMAQEE